MDNQETNILEEVTNFVEKMREADRLLNIALYGFDYQQVNIETFISSTREDK